VFDTDGSAVRIPKLTGIIEPSWHGENEQIDEVGPTWDEVTLLPSNIASVKSLTRCSNELARQSVVRIAQRSETTSGSAYPHDRTRVRLASQRWPRSLSRRRAMASRHSNEQYRRFACRVGLITVSHVGHRRTPGGSTSPAARIVHVHESASRLADVPVA
jgi:hypothetical protein